MVTVMALLGLLLALGRYNPVYVGVLKLTGFYAFRNPSKFLFFSITFASVLAGIGFTRFFGHSDEAERSRGIRWTVRVLIVATSIFFGAKAILAVCRDKIIEAGDWAVRSFIYGRPYHRYDLQYYMCKVRGVYDDLVSTSSLTDVYNKVAILFVAVTLLICLRSLRRRAGWLRGASLSLILIDLYVFSMIGTGFRGNIESFDVLRPEAPRILKVLQEDARHSLFRVLPFDIGSGRLPNWSVPNANSMYGIDSVAAYTPLVSMAYKERLAGLEAVDDALGLVPPSGEALFENYELLRLLNVKYVISPGRLAHPFLRQAGDEGGICLYELRGYLPRVFFTDMLTDGMEARPPVYLEVLEYSDGIVRAVVETDRDGFLVLSEYYYPGWRVSVDGGPAEVICVHDIVQAVALKKGRRNVAFEFVPDFSIWGGDNG